MRGRNLIAALVLAAPALAIGTPATAATTVGTADAGLTGFADLVVDDEHGHVFISQGSGTVVVTDLAGRRTGAIALPRSTAMVLAPDGDTVYVALPDATSVAAIDTATLAVRRFPLGAGICPVSLAVSAGLVWFGEACDSQFGTIGALDPRTGTVTPNLVSGRYNPVLAASPLAPANLVVVEAGLSPSTLYAYDLVGGDHPRITQRAAYRTDSSNSRDLAYSSDGTSVVVASGAPYRHLVYRVSDLTQVGSYGTTYYPDAVAVRGDGLVAAGVDNSAPSVYLFHEGEFDADEVVDPSPDVEDYLLTGGLAFGARYLYAVTGNVSGQPPTLHVLDPGESGPVTTTPSVTTISAPADAVAGTPVDVRVRVTTTESNPAVAVYLVDGDQRTLAAEGRADADGNLTVSVTPVHTGSLEAVYAGTDGVAGSSAGTPIAVRARVGAKPEGYLRNEGGAFVYRLGRAASVRVGVYPAHPGDCAQVRSQRRLATGGWGQERMTCVRLDDHGLGSGAVRAGGTEPVLARVRVEWPGDPTNSAAVGPWLRLRFVR